MSDSHDTPGQDELAYLVAGDDPIGDHHIFVTTDMHTEPDLALLLGFGIRLGGPLAEAGDGHDAAPLDLA